MARNEKKRQQSLQRKAAKRRQKQDAARQMAPVKRDTPRAVLKSAAKWPLLECLVSRDWQTPGEIVQTLVARRSPAGDVAAGVFLVDLGCLGVKDAFASLFASQAAYERGVRKTITSQQPMIATDLNLVAKIIREGIAYARQFGFSPHRDYYEPALLLAEADPDACPASVPLGFEGKPHFINGPYDNVPKILRQLTKTAGPGNFHFTLGAPPGEDPTFLLEQLEQLGLATPETRLIEADLDDDDLDDEACDDEDLDWDDEEPIDEPPTSRSGLIVPKPGTLSKLLRRPFQGPPV